MPGIVKQEGPAGLRIRYDSSVLQNPASCLQCLLSAASRFQAVPISHHRMPDTYLPDSVFLFQLIHTGAQSPGKLIPGGVQPLKHLLFIIRIQPAVINQYPANRNLLVCQLLHFFFYPVLGNLMVKSIPAAPAEVFKHIRKRTLLPEHLLLSGEGKRFFYRLLTA